ncbi:hypothetical protein [Succinivibrio sp.]|uniref:hypothetical protein n=1 Tax=Succinivibrio sp. TaxID=2053619 RepID=UPI0038665ABE
MSTDVEDYYVCTDDRFNDKKTIRSYHEWEELYYKKMYPLHKGKNMKMYLEFVEWHYVYLNYRYTK